MGGFYFLVTCSDQLVFNLMSGVRNIVFFLKKIRCRSDVGVS